ncbi:MAG: hypothetical protein D6743_15820 [Calditrichaeota bacterium]|nr:MAG: hypothetical protein D6743_15820 [Calditrichota bacterium]
MTYNPNIHHRRSIRLKNYDYSRAGAYFVTLCTHNRECLFGEIIRGELALNQFGKTADQMWMDIGTRFPHVELDEYVIMPNHMHAILVFTASVGAIHESPLRMSVRERRNMALPKLIGRFKMLSAKRINELRHTSGTPVWQRNYYEHIIRNENDLNRIRKYIMENPLKWGEDRYHA